MFLSKMSVNRPVTVTMLILVFVVFGAMAYFSLAYNLLPDIKLPVVSVQTIYPGAGPEEIETQISKKIEDQISTVSNIDFIQSYSMDNASIVLVKFKMGKDVDIANQEIKDKIDSIINDFPADAQKPIVAKIDLTEMPVMNLVLSGDQSLLELTDYAENVLKDRLSQIHGVGQVNLEGSRKREIQIELTDQAVYQNSLSILQLSQILAAYNLDLPAGNFKSDKQEVAVKIKGQYIDVDQIKDLDVPTATGVKKLNQIANIKDSGEEVRKRSTYFNVADNTKNDNVIRINVLKSSDGNPVEISKQLRKELPSILASLPAGMTLHIVDDSSKFIERAVSDTLSNIYLGILLTGLVLLFFLYDLRSTFIVAISMPVSIIATFSVMKMAGFSMNIMTLLGLSTSVGTLVTNSVVVLENIFRHKNMGHNSKDSAQIGTSEIAIAVLASTLTNVVVFIPIGTMSSIAGQFFKEFALTVTFATIFSIIISFTLTPMLASLILPEKPKKGRLGNKLEKMFNSWERAYKGILVYVMGRKKRSVFYIFIAILLFFSSLFVASKIGFEFMPILDDGNLQINVELPQGYTLSETSNTVQQIENIIAKHKEVQHILFTLGSKGSIDTGLNLANASVKLIDAKEREISTQQLADLLIKDLSIIPNADIKVKVQSSADGGGSAGVGGGEPITMYLYGQENKELDDIRVKVMNAIADIPGLINLDSSSRSGKVELVVKPRMYELLQSGSNVAELALNLRAIMAGSVSTQLKQQENEYDIMVTFDEGSYDSIDKIKNITIMTAGGPFRLSQLADVHFEDGINKVIRRDKAKTVEVTGSPATGVPIGNITKEINHRLAKFDFPAGYGYKWGGSAQMMNETVTDMAKAALLAILLTYMLLAAILESFVQPLLILSTIPLALIGVFYVQYLSGLTMNIFSMMSIIMLVGIVVNNAILILDYTNQLRWSGMTVRQALIKAAPVKLKAILMSNISIILGMAPMAMGIGSSGKEFRQAMGIVSIGGLIASTILTLVIIPMLYYVVTKNVVKLKKLGPQSK